MPIAEGLWYWTAPHPDWEPGADWPKEVGCVYYEAPEHVVLIDPLVPAGTDEERFWEALDRDVERLGNPVAVLVTVHWHERSVERVASRYAASVWRHEAPVDLPSGVEGLDADEVEETLFWIPEHGALVPGDAVLADEDGLRICPISWLPDGADAGRFHDSLRRLLELPVERILVSHGAPVLVDAAAALARAVDHAPSAA